MSKKQKRLWLIRSWHHFTREYLHYIYTADKKPVCILQCLRGEKTARWRVRTSDACTQVLRLPSKNWHFFVPYITIRAGRVREIIQTNTGLQLKEGDSL